VAIIYYYCIRKVRKLVKMSDKGSSSESLLNSEKDELLPTRSKYSSTRSAWTFWLVYTTAVVVLGSSFQFGFGTTCMNAPEKVNSEIYGFI